MYGAACSSDSVTIESWRKIWCDNVTSTHKRFGSFKEHSVGKLFNSNQYKPAVVIGSGPSLSYNGHLLKDRGGILAISCLHNYHFFEDRDVFIDYYVSLDAGPVVLEELSEGGKKTEAEYWESTKNKTLIAFIGSHPDLFEKWQGKVFLFNAPIPDKTYIETMGKLEEFNVYISNGGNVLGACTYIAKGIMGANPLAFIGADFSFGYNTGSGHHFHSWDSKYDKQLGSVMRSVDVFGNKVLTWPSYHNFKCWFDWLAISIPGIYINCTEGGTFGAYTDGNLMAVRQMELIKFIEMYHMNEPLRASCENPGIATKTILF